MTGFFGSLAHLARVGCPALAQRSGAGWDGEARNAEEWLRTWCDRIYAIKAWELGKHGRNLVESAGVCTAGDVWRI